MDNYTLPKQDISVLKFVILGDSNVGKTSVLHHFMFSKFNKEPKHTVSVEFSSKIIKIGEKEAKLQLWDTAGQEKYRSVTRSYYKGAVGVLIVYDITKADSFSHIQNWLNDAKNGAKKDCVICVVGNKSDLKDQRVVKYNDGAKFCQDNKCSAFTGENIENIFNLMTKNILNKIEDGTLVLNENSIMYIKNEPNSDGKSSICSSC